MYDKAMGAIKPRNIKLAGQKHPVTKVPFTKGGYPDFSAHLYSKKGVSPDVEIGELTGYRSLDERLANAAAGLEKTPEGYVWHHHEQKGRMQLVEKWHHNKTGHTGGYAIYKQAAATLAGTVAAIENASAEDIMSAVGEMFVPIGLTTETLAPGALYGEGSKFPDYDSYMQFNERLNSLKSSNGSE